MLARLGERDNGWERFNHYQSHGAGLRLRPALGLSAFSGDGVTWLDPGSEEPEELEEEWVDEEFVSRRAPLTATTRVIRGADRESVAIRGARVVRGARGLDRARSRRGGPAKVRSAVLDRVMRIATASGGARAQRVRRAVEMLASRPADEQEIAGQKLLRSMVGSERALARTWSEPVGAGVRPVERVATRLRDAAGRVAAVEKVRRSRRAASAVPSFARPGAVARDGSSPLLDAALAAEIPGVADAGVAAAGKNAKQAPAQNAKASTAASNEISSTTPDTGPSKGTKGGGARSTAPASAGSADDAPKASQVAKALREASATTPDAQSRQGQPTTSAPAGVEAQAEGVAAARGQDATAVSPGEEASVASLRSAAVDGGDTPVEALTTPTGSRGSRAATTRAARAADSAGVVAPVVASAPRAFESNAASPVLVDGGVLFESDVFDDPIPLEVVDALEPALAAEGPLSRAAERSTGVRLTARQRDSVVDRVFRATEDGTSRSLVPRVVGARLDAKVRKPFLASPDETVAMPHLAEAAADEVEDETLYARPVTKAPARASKDADKQEAKEIKAARVALERATSEAIRRADKRADRGDGRSPSLTGGPQELRRAGATGPSGAETANAVSPAPSSSSAGASSSRSGSDRRTPTTTAAARGEGAARALRDSAPRDGDSGREAASTQDEASIRAAGRSTARGTNQLSRVAMRAERMVQATESDQPLRGAQAAGAPEAERPEDGLRVTQGIMATEDAAWARVEASERLADAIEEGKVRRASPSVRASRRAYYVDTVWARPQVDDETDEVLEGDEIQSSTTQSASEARKARRAQGEAVQAAVERERAIHQRVEAASAVQAKREERRNATWRRVAARTELPTQVDGLGVPRTVPSPVEHIVSRDASPAIRKVQDRGADPASRVLSRWSSVGEAVAPVVAAIAQQVALEGGGETAIVRATAAAFGVGAVEAREIVRSAQRSRATAARQQFSAALRGTGDVRSARTAWSASGDMVMPTPGETLAEAELGELDELPQGQMAAARARGLTTGSTRGSQPRPGTIDTASPSSARPSAVSRARTGDEARTQTARTRVLRISGRDSGGVKELSTWRRAALPRAASFTLLQSLASLGVDVDQDVIDALVPSLPPGVAARFAAVARSTGRTAVAGSSARPDGVMARAEARADGTSVGTAQGDMRPGRGATGSTPARTAAPASMARAAGLSAATATVSGDFSGAGGRSSTLHGLLRRASSKGAWGGFTAQGVLPNPVDVTLEDVYVDENGDVVAAPAGVGGTASRRSQAGRVAGQGAPGRLTAGANEALASAPPSRSGRARSVATASRRAIRALPTTSAAKHEWAASAPVFEHGPERPIRPLERVLGATPDQLMARPGAAARTASRGVSRSSGSVDAAYLSGAAQEATVWSPDAGGYVPASMASNPVAALEAGFGDPTRALPSVVAQAQAGAGIPALAGLRIPSMPGAGPEGGATARRRDSLRRAMTRARDPLALARVLVEHRADARGLASEMPNSTAHLMREIVTMTTLPEDAQEVLSAQVMSSGGSAGGGNRRRGSSRRQMRASARRALGMPGGAPSTASSSKGVSESRLSKLSKKLQSLIHLAENDQAAAANRVRRSEEAVEAPVESDNAADSSMVGVTFSSLQRELLGSVMHEVDDLAGRREGGPNVDIWW